MQSMPNANVASESIAKILGGSNEQAKLHLLKGNVICKGDDGFSISLGNSQKGKCALTESADLTAGTEADFIVIAVQRNGVKILSRRLYLVLAELDELQRKHCAVEVNVRKITTTSNRQTGLDCLFDSGILKGFAAHLPSWSLTPPTELRQLVSQKLPVIVNRLTALSTSPYVRITVRPANVSPQSDPKLLAKLTVGSIEQVTILKFIKSSIRDKNKGLLVQLKNGAIGTIMREDVAGYPNSRAEETFKCGEKIEARIERVSVPNNTLNLTMRHKERELFFAAIEKGMVLEGRVTRGLIFGVLVDLGHGHEGLIRTKDLGQADGKPEVLNTGKKVLVQVLDFSEDKRTMYLSRNRIYGRTKEVHEELNASK